MGVLLVGSLLGTRLGTISMLVYLAVGAIGLPVFTAGNSGIEYMQGATLGYLAAYPVVAAVMGWFAERGWDQHIMTNIVALIIGSLIFYVLGAGWLATGLGMGLGEAFTKGVVPFIIGDTVKVAIAVGVLPGAWRLLGSDKQRD
jgi:biotin transport system substrate-specific component